ncbi:protein TolA [Pseudoxanthomonas kalamensis DSM 18571]|uniref:cell envelope integrity protein TolA n=1 Tax=Pseudoxanthomonas kalamensis TaxID=289483 RepID=UPI001390ADAA|nr:cell envelope integrity protein TolA [Pseudoxanthomonas kalamensis]KAF1711109.1 protein TolA [Pseudoxanthomonas kalamensis DSM 18571]
MHAETLPRNGYDDGGLGGPLALAIGVHLLLALLLWLAARIEWDHDPAAAGAPVIEATMDTTAAEDRAVRRALRDDPLPLPEPVEPEPVEEDTAPPPQPIPEPRPQDAPVPQQTQAQERIPVPDRVDQDEVSADAIAQETARKEQEAKRRQEQIDLTERQRQQEAENRLRLAKQQEEEQKKRDEEARQKKLAAIRAERAKLDREKARAEQKLRQINDAQAAQASSANAVQYGSESSAPAGQAGVDEGLRARYAAAIQEAVLRQWVRPESVPLGTRCRVVIRQLPGGEVISAEVQSGCAMDAAGRDSVERAVLKAQPLPYRGYESVFSRTLTLNFEAQDR